MCHSFWVAKNSKPERGISQFAVDFFCLEGPENFVEESFCVLFKKLSVTEYFLDKA